MWLSATLPLYMASFYQKLSTFLTVGSSIERQNFFDAVNVIYIMNSLYQNDNFTLDWLHSDRFMVCFSKPIDHSSMESKGCYSQIIAEIYYIKSHAWSLAGTDIYIHFAVYLSQKSNPWHEPLS